MGVTEPLGQGEIDHGLEDTAAHGGDDGGKGPAHDDTDGHVHHVSAVDEFLVFSDEGLDGMDAHDDLLAVMG